MEKKHISKFALDQWHVGELTSNQEKELAQEVQEEAGEGALYLEAREERIAELHKHEGFQALLDMEFQRHQELKAHEAQPPTKAKEEPATSSFWQLCLSWWRKNHLFHGHIAGFASVVGATLLLVFTQGTSFSLLQDAHNPEPSNKTTVQKTAPVKKLSAQKAKKLVALKTRIAPAKTRASQAKKKVNPEKRIAPKKKKVFKRKAKSIQPLFRMLYARKGSSRSQWLKNNQALKEGDLVQFSYVSPIPYYIMVVGVNEKGESYVFAPYKKKKSIRISSGHGKIPNDTALELDDYLGLERFFFVYSDKPFQLKILRSSIKKAFQGAKGKLLHLRSLPGTWQVKTLLIRKVK